MAAYIFLDIFPQTVQTKKLLLICSHKRILCKNAEMTFILSSRGTLSA